MHGEAHYVCHRCGWTFPNTHPSAKHRRAHKKVCGKLEGFKVIESENDPHLAVSDDEHHSDESHNKVAETSNNVKGNGEIGGQVSNKSEEEEFSDAVTEFVDAGTNSKVHFVEGSTASNNMIQPSKDPSDDTQIQCLEPSENVEAQMVTETNLDHTSSSAVHSMVPANASPENTQTGECAAYSMQVINDMSGEANANGTVSTDEIASELFEKDAILQKMNDVTKGEISLVVDSKEEETSALEQKLSQDEISPSDAEGCYVKDVNESLPVLPKHGHMHVEQLSEMTAEDCKDRELLTSEKDLIPDFSKAKKETELNPKSFEGGESAELTVAAAQVLEENLQQEEVGSKIMVQEVLVECQANVSVPKDTISKDLASDELEALTDSTSSGLTSETEKDQIVSSFEVQEPHCGQQEESSETLLVVAAGENTIVSPSDVVTHEATDANSDQGSVLKEARTDNSDITVMCVGGAIEKNFTKITPESLSVADCLSENMTETLSDAPGCQDEEFQKGSKELEVSKSTVLSSISETKVQEPIGADSRVTKPLHEEMELNHSGDVGLIRSCSENTKIEESMLSAVDSGSCLLSSGKVEDNNAKSSAGDPSDIYSRPLKAEEDNNCIKQLSESTAVAPPDFSVDSISQTDSVDGNWGSVSDGTALSVKDASDVPGSENAAPKEASITDSEKTRGASEDHRSGSTYIFEAPFMTLVEPGKEGDIKSASPEIQTVENPQQVQPSSQTGWFPSITQVVNESQGRKKNEEIIEKVASWNSGKSHTPLKSLLVEANLESKQKGKTAENHPTQKTDASTAHDDDGISAKTVHPTSAVGMEVTAKSNEEKEWNSPARLPVAVSSEKRKNKHWIPFMCCSSVN